MALDEEPEIVVLSDSDEPEPEPEPVKPTEKMAALYCVDPKLNYLFGSNGEQGDIDAVSNNVEYISYQDPRINYSIKQEDKIQEDDEPDLRDSIGFMSVNSVDEGIAWYRNNFPKVPEELYPIMARWNWGDLKDLTKKDVKNDKKRVAKGKRSKKEYTFTRKTGNFVVDFT
jgi:hypothetical protein